MTAVTLVVPIDVAALCVGTPDVEHEDSGDATTLAPLADFSLLPYFAHGKIHNGGPYIGEAVLEDATPFAGSTPLAAGVHLHWALPDGLTHGVQGTGTDAALEFPAVPNRWLVTRVAAGAPASGAPARVRSWVVESDRLSQTPTAPAGVTQPTVPVNPDELPNFRYIGQAFDLPTWREDGTAERLSPLTAMGYGEPTFAALYPNSSTVFGMLDTLTDLAGQTGDTLLAYHVVGWYSSPAADPLSQQDADAVAARLQWSWDGPGRPATTVCSGLAENIVWNPARAYLAAEQPKPLSVAIGNTAADAVSALMAAVLAPEHAGDAELLLDALQFGLLARPGQADLLATLDEALHRSGTASTPGGTVWSVTALPPDASAQTESGPAPVSAIARTLDALNVLQRTFDALHEELRTLREQLFSDWCKYLLVRYRPSDVPALQQQLPAVQADLEAQVAAITAIAGTGGRIETLAKDIDTQATALGTALPPGQRLTADAAAPRYHAPADPVLVLSGADAVAPARYGGDTRGSADGRLACRLDSQVVRGATLPADLVAGSRRLDLEASALGGLGSEPAGVPATLAQALVREALLLAPSLQPSVATAVAGAGGDDNPVTINRAQTVAALSAAAKAFLAGTPVSTVQYAGHAPAALMVNTWTGTPWLPVMLDYDAEFSAVQALVPGTADAAYLPTFLNAEFALNPDTSDLAYTGTAPAGIVHYTGRTILSGDAMADLVDEGRRYLDHTPDADKELRKVLSELGSTPVLAQRLTGMLEAMLMRSLTLQLPVADPLGSFGDTALANDVLTAVAGETALSPLPENHFNPIRAGGLAIGRLRLVDAFGRTKEYIAPPVAVSHALTPPTGLLPDGHAFLPPRLAQPARLSVRWLAAGDDAIESNDDPSTTPIAGWVLPIWLDRALAMYDADGTPVGELSLSADGTRVLWTPGPGGPFASDTPIAVALAGRRPALREFALAAYGSGDASYFKPLLAAVRNALTAMLPPSSGEHAELAVLVGQPLVLATAGLRLDVAGALARDQSWASYSARILGETPTMDGGLPQVRFPVRLGSLGRLADTLVGYWLERSGQIDYRTFHALAATSTQDGVGPPAQDTVTLSPGAVDAPPLKATLLLDPRGLVHATTGILPVKAITIPPVHVRAAGRSLAPALQTRPVLATADAAQLSIALPKTSAGRWQWIAVSDGRWTTTPAHDAPAGAALADAPQRIAEGWLRLAADDDITT